MSSLTAYRGLNVVTPDPTGLGGLAIQNDLKLLVDWHPKSVWAQSGDPGVGNDQTQNYFPGSLWFNTTASPARLWVCLTSSTGAATWQQILLQNATAKSSAPGATDDSSKSYYPSSLWIQTNTTPATLYVCQSSAVGAAVWVPVLIQVIQDTAPKLGGNLDVNGKQIVSASNGNIVLLPNGTGKVGIGTASPNSLLHVNGPIATPVVSKTAAYTIVATDSVILGDATTAAFTLTLPTAASIAGRQYTLKRLNSGANAVTVAAQSGQTIDGATTKVLSTQYQSLQVVSDGSTNWWIL